MDKRAARILLGCFTCAIIVFVLFLVAMRLKPPSCELISAEPTQLRAAAMGEWAKLAPKRSHDRSMVLKLSGFIEYNISPAQEQPDKQAPASTSTQAPAVQAQPAALGQPAPAPLGAHAGNATLAANQTAQAATSSRLPSPSVPRLAIAGEQPVAPQRAARRYLPFALADLESRQTEAHKFRYSLSLNCSTLHMVFVRKPERVYVERMSLELRPRSRARSSCELSLATPTTFEVEVSSAGVAHFACTQPLRYACVQPRPANPANQSGLVVAELHLHAIEFETGPANASNLHPSAEFVSAASECRAPQ